MINFRIIIFFIVDRYWSLLFYLFTNVLSYYFTVLKQWYNQISQVKVLTQRPHTEQGEVADPEVHPLDPEGEWADSEEVCYWYVIKLPCTIASFKNWFLCLLHRHVCSHLQIVIYSSSIACPRLGWVCILGRVGVWILILLFSLFFLFLNISLPSDQKRSW